MFNSIDGGSNKNCKNGAKWLDGGAGTYDCRFPETLVKQWNIAATYNMDNALLGKKLQVGASGVRHACCRSPICWPAVVIQARHLSLMRVNLSKKKSIHLRKTKQVQERG